MKIIFRLTCFGFMVLSLLFIPAGCGSHETDKVNDQHETVSKKFDTGEQPYDIKAEKSAAGYPQKSALALSQLQKGRDFAKAHGIETLIEILKNPDDLRRNSFISKNCYIWIIKTDYNSKAIIEVHPINKAITGRDFLEIKDSDGKEFIKDILRIVLYKGKGWVSYKWAHPRLKKAQEKLTFVEKYDDRYILCDGFYLKD